MERRISPAQTTTPNWQAGARRRIPFYLITTLLLALLTAVITFNYLDNLRESSVATGVALVALQDIRVGALLTEDMLEEREIPEGALPEQHLTSKSEALGRIALVPLAAGEVLLHGKISGNVESGLSGNLPDGHWAIVLPAEWLVGPVPELAAGDRIELLAYQSGMPLGKADVIVSAVEVIQFTGDPENPERLTLAVTMEEAKSILYARVNGLTLMPMLRPRGG